MSTAAITTEQRANTAFQRVMESAPMGLLISAAVGLAIVGVFQYIFYLGILPAGWSPALRAVLSGAIAAFFEALGLFFLITTVRDFSAHARREALLGLTATFLLWAYAVWEGTHVAAAFDGNTPETYWAVFGIIGTIICIVRIVELRIALTVTSAIQRTDDRKLIADLTGKLQVLEAEKQADTDRKQADAKRIENERIEAEKQFAVLEELHRQEQLREAIEEAEKLRRQLARVEKKEPAPTGKNKINPDTVTAHVRKFLRISGGIAPSQRQVAAALNVDERTIRNEFHNGSWAALISALTAETQPELTSHS